MSNVPVKGTGSNAVRNVERYDWNFPTIFGRSAWDDLFGNFFEDFEKCFGRDQVVPCDVIQHKDDKGVLVSTEIQYALAGYDKDNVSIEVDGNILTLVVDKTEKTEDAPESKQYVHKGISRRRIEASYNLNGYDKDNIQASFENGVLSLKIPVAQKSEAKKIEVK
jgi:HSP20 family molecular chaperone IbpA